MKKIKVVSSNSFKRIVFFVFVLSVVVMQGQTTGTQQDTIKKPVSLGTISLKNPKSVVSKYEYDPVLNRYILTQKVGDFNLKHPLILTPAQYQKLIEKESMNDYFHKKLDAYSGKKAGAKEERKNLLPSFYVNSAFFESLFGGTNIDVVPQGSVAMDLGVIYQKNDNPALSPRNRSNISFDFDQRISLSLLGKVGERLQVTANYDTEATFDFQNLIKLDYTPTEDDIIRKIEVGNISMPLNSSLITGAQSLFGVKTELQFGRLTVTGVFSEQRSQNRTVVAQGGGTVNEFSFFARDYDEDKHFFLAQYFRDNYDKALENYPYIRSQVQITRIEVWVTNRGQLTQNVRNVVAIQDLGEYDATSSVFHAKTRITEQSGGNPPAGFFNTNTGSDNSLPRNNANDYDPALIEAGGGALSTAIRDVATVQAGFNVPGYTVNQGFDYAVLENARKLEQGRDFDFNTQLGYISLNQRLSNDEVLGVAFQYTYKGEVYQVGEFGNGGIEATGVVNSGTTTEITNNTLVLKLLKSNITSVADPIWNLMMKNIYSTGAFQLSQEDFKLNILYVDPTPKNYITPIDETTWPNGLDKKVLLDVFNFDRLNAYNDVQPGGDGFFDYLPGITIDTQSGRIIFTKVEPFGEYIHDVLGAGDYHDESSYNPNQEQYVFSSMYNQTKSAALEDAGKNKFQLNGKYKSEGSNGIPIGAFNVPRGSVKVTAGGRILQEGIDYTVNYQAGTVQIIDPGLEASNVPIEISVENNAVFGQQTRRFSGFNMEYKFSDKFMAGATLINLKEKPLTQKANYGTEPVNNTMYGINANYSTEVPFLTRLVNKLPNIDTDAESNFSIRGEFAYLQAKSPKSADFNGETTVYLEDFEGAQSLIDIRSALGWSLASKPLFFGDLTGSAPTEIENITNGFGRAKLAWYTIDPIFYTKQRPSEISDSDVSSNQTRRIFIDEIFPDQDIAQGQQTVQNTLDLAYYPNQKGPYNLEKNTDFDAAASDDKWGGIMRSLSSTNFEQSNVEFVQFWVLDPYVDGISGTGGELVFNLGNISEDVLKDGKKQYENGLPGVGSTDLVSNTSWGRVPSTQSLVYAFDADSANRNLQDLGYDGNNDADEVTRITDLRNESGVYEFEGGTGDDPMLDNYQYYLAREGGVLQRYLDYNNPQGNSPVSVSNSNRGSTTLPDVEDIDRDLTMNTVNSYFEYRIKIGPETTINSRFVSDIKEVSVTAADDRLVNARWIQYKIPINPGNYDLTNINDAAVHGKFGGIEDLRSISFMRMYLTGFTEDVVLRFATLDLVRGDWRTYGSSLFTDESKPKSSDTKFDVTTVNVEENSSRNPIPYVVPPGVFREQLNNNNTIIRQNEQSLSLKVENLKAEDSRAVYKNINVDIRQYKRLKMFVHAERITMADDSDDLVGFLRLGTDFKENFYQVEKVLEFTEFGASSDTDIWKEANNLEISLSVLSAIKTKAIANNSLNDVTFYDVDATGVVSENSVGEFDARIPGGLRIGIKGNPSLGNVRTMMLGIKNSHSEPGEDVDGEVWYNELRLSELDNGGGWAAVAAMNLNFADFADVAATGNISTAGFGAIDQTPNERKREKAVSYDLVSNINLGQLLPKKWGIQLPFNFGISEELITPEFDPVYDDLRLDERIDNAKTEEDKDVIRRQAEDYTKRQSINFIGVKKNRTGDKTPRFYDVENFTFNYSYNEVNHRDFEIEALKDQNVKAGFVYSHNFNPVTVAPFAKKDSVLTSRYWQWLKDFNFNVLPTSISVNSNVNRAFNSQQFRDVQVGEVDPNEQLGLPELQQRNFLFNWQYSINYNITKSLRANLTATNASIVRNYFDENNEIDKSLTIWDGFWDAGDPNRHSQQLQVNYDIPFNKIPFLSFVKGTYTYTSNFDWQRGGDALVEIAGEQINTVQNSGIHAINSTLSFTKFYKYLGLTKSKKRRRTVASKADALTKKSKGKSTSTKKRGGLADFGIGLLTMIKRVNINYKENSGKVLPGYTQSVGFIGTTRPSLGFVFGSQSDVRFEAAKKGWITSFEDFNEQYTDRTEQQLDVTATATPFKGLTIDFVANRQQSETYSENFDILDDNTYDALLGNTYGSFSISNLMISTAFVKSDEFNSETFNKFRANRLQVANRLAAQRGIDLNDPANIDEEGYPRGYGKTSQDVLLPAFLAAYSGQDAGKVKLGAFRNVPIPNWNMKYTGLTKLKWFKKRFKRFSLSHGYRSSYSINSYQTNLEKQVDANAKDVSGNFLSDNLFNNVTLVDQFNPLMRVDFEMKNSISFLAEIKMDRAMSLSFDNSLLTEINGKEYKIGLGYRIKDVRFKTNIGGKKTTLKGDLNLKGDFSLRDNITIIRNLDIDNNQITSGQKLLAFKFTADYALSKNLNVLFFYDHAFSEFAVSTAFPQTTINSGFTLRYNFGN